MGLTYEYDPVANIVRTQAEGVVSTADFRQYVLGILHDASIKSGFVEVFSVEHAEDLLVSFRELLPFHDLWRDYLRKGCRATIIYAPDDLGFGIMRMFQAAIGAEEQNADVPFLVVRDPDELNAALTQYSGSRR